ncbi:MAG: hypothetical protein RR795_01585 [Cetobacterium sp.]|uniref:hypothetical protein n=1 Tax=Cetobacterium sp. TaxID=2071632 RepID=UPI002FC9D82A
METNTKKIMEEKIAEISIFRRQMEMLKETMSRGDNNMKIKIGDKVILRTCIELRLPCPASKGTVFDVLFIDGNMAKIQNEETVIIVQLETLVKVEINDEKKKEIKIIKKLEDLDGLKNKKGWELSFQSDDNFKDKGYYQKWIRIDEKNDKGWFSAIYRLNEQSVERLKGLGFEFEYKPLRSEEEIMNDLIEKKFKFGEGNYILIKHEHGFYDYKNNITFYTPGQKYYSLESLKKVIAELNEILYSEN